MDPQAVSRVDRGLHKLVTASPENLCFNSQLRDIVLSKVYLVAFVVDEALCIVIVGLHIIIAYTDNKTWI